MEENTSDISNTRNSKNKIAFVARNFPVYSQTFITNQVIYAQKNGFNVSVLSYNKSNFNESSQKELLAKYNIKSLVSIIDFNFPKSHIIRYIKGLYLYCKFLKYSAKLKYKSVSDFMFFKPYLIEFFFKYRDTDVFHMHFADAGLDIASMKTAGLLKGDLILSLHGFSIHYANELEKKKIASTYKELFDQSKVITVNSQYLLERMISLGCLKSKLVILPMGVDTDFFKINNLKEIKGKLNLISVGRLIELKGHEFGIKSIKLLIDKGVNLEYTIVGEGKLKSELQELAKEYKIEEHIKFVGNKSQAELKELYAKSHVFLMTSITDSKGRAEAQGVVTLEAQAMGLPVVAFDSGGVKSTITNNTGFLIKEKDVNDFAAAILKVHDDKPLYSNMSRNAIQFVNENFSLDKLSKKVVDLYN